MDIVAHMDIVTHMTIVAHMAIVAYMSIFSHRTRVWPAIAALTVRPATAALTMFINNKISSKRIFLLTLSN